MIANNSSSSSHWIFRPGRGRAPRGNRVAGPSPDQQRDVLATNWIGRLVRHGQLDLRHPYSSAATWFPGGSVINNGGTATIGSGDNLTDNSGYGIVILGGSGYGLNGSGNGYVNMSGGTLDLSGTNVVYIEQEVLGVNSGSGIFTQSGGLNVPYAKSVMSGYNLSYNTLQLATATEVTASTT